MAGCNSQLGSCLLLLLPPAMSDELFFAILGEKELIFLNVDMTWTVGKLQSHIKEMTEITSPAHKLRLYRANIDIKTTPRVMEQIWESSIKFQREELFPAYELSEYWGKNLPKTTIHVLVELPPGESINSIDPRAWS